MGLSVVAGSVDGLVGLVGPSSDWFLGPALRRCCWLLFSGVWSQGGWLKNPRGPGASAISPVGRVRVPKDLGAVAHSLAGEDRTWG